jgi:hypothetical protein
MNASRDRTFALVISLLALMMVVSCSPPNPPPGTPTASSAPSATATLGMLRAAVVPNAMPGEDEIAVYPGATGIEKAEENAPLGRSIYFVTPDSLDKVYEFYKTTYTSQGWVLNEKRITFFDADFIWADPDGQVPWNVGLGLDVYNQVAGGTKYVVWVERQADPDNVPVIEGASDVRVFMSDSALDELKELDLGSARIISYTTKTSAKDVLESYRYHMESYGWRSRDEKESEVSFSYSYGVPERMYFNVAIIQATTEDDGKTHVIVGAAGNDLHPIESDAYKPPVARVAKLLPSPAKVPTYPGGTSASVYDPTSWRTRLFGIESMDAWTTTDSTDKVKDFYTDSLTKQGWKKAEHPRSNWHRFIYDTGPTCQSRHTVYLILESQSDNSTKMTIITYLGCYVISGDE